MNMLLCLATCVVVVASVGASSSFSSELNPFLPVQPVDDAPSSLRIETRYIRQRVDNFDTNNHRYFNQRYLANTDFYAPGGPLFVLLGGFVAVNPRRLEESLPYGLARQLRGSVFYLEHRYYGNSIPVNNLTDANLRYLTVDQALADVAHFVTDIQRRYSSQQDRRPAVIVVGGHYSGNLAAWFQQKYPHLSAGAWASSAPVLSVVNHQLYKETAAATYRSIGGDACYNAIESGFAAIETLVQNGQLDELSAIFSLCPASYLRTDRSISLFFALIAEAFAVIVQTSTPASIRGVCQVVQNPAAVSPVHAILNVLQSLGNGTAPGSEWCLTLDYDNFIEQEREVELDSFAVRYGIRQRTYQQCTQLGWQHTSDSPNQPFGNRFPLEFNHQHCASVFGDLFNPASTQATSDRINVIYGGQNPEARNVLYTYGELDPWRTIGVLEGNNYDEIVLVIPDSPQGAELGDFNSRDSYFLNIVKNAISSTLRYWIVRNDFNHRTENL